MAKVMKGPKQSTQPKAYYMHLLLGLIGKILVCSFQSQNQASEGNPLSHPEHLVEEQSASSQSFRGERLPESVMREKPNVNIPRDTYKPA